MSSVLAFLLVALPATPTMLEAQTLHDEIQFWEGVSDTHRSPSADIPSYRAPVAGVETWRYLAEEFFPGEANYTLAVMACESGGHPEALGAAGEIGLMQIYPKHWSGLSHDLWDPWENMRVAAIIRSTAGGWGHWTCARQIGLP